MGTTMVVAARNCSAKMSAQELADHRVLTISSAAGARASTSTMKDTIILSFDIGLG